MHASKFRFAVWLAVVFTAASFVVAAVYDLPYRDPDSIAGPTYFRLPAILLAAFIVDVVPRAIWRRRQSGGTIRGQLRSVIAERWTWSQVKFTLIGLAAWYAIYVAFRNLKSSVPFVNLRLWDTELAQLDRWLFLGHDPAVLLHNALGTGFAAYFLSFIYILWIGLVPFTLAIALVWTRNSLIAAWYVTAIAVDWVIGAAIYFLVPSLGPVYSRPAVFDELPHTWNTDVVNQLMEERHEVLTRPFATDAVQTIAAFASLHVGIMVTMIVIAELARFPMIVRWTLRIFGVLTLLATVYLGWHFFVDTIAGAALGYAGVVIAAWGTGISIKRLRSKDGVAATEVTATPTKAG